MTVITYRGRPLALPGRERFYLAPQLAARLDANPLKTFVCYLAAYSHDVLTGELADEPRGSTSRRAPSAAPASA